jgi:hypothetical protein
MSKELDKQILLEIFGEGDLYDVRVDLDVISKRVPLIEAKHIVSQLHPSTKDKAAILSSRFVPSFSSDLSEALKLVDEMVKLGWPIFLLQRVNFGYPYEANFGNRDEYFSGISENPAEAVCLAALEAIRNAK